MNNVVQLLGRVGGVVAVTTGSAFFVALSAWYGYVAARLIGF